MEAFLFPFPLLLLHGLSRLISASVPPVARRSQVPCGNVLT